MKVVVLSFNHHGITKDCLDSALNFFKPADIVLVHNGSIGTSIKELQSSFPQVHHLILKENKGFSGGANSGLKYFFDQGADKILFLSNDTKLTKFSIPPEGDLVALHIELRDTGRCYSLGGRIHFSKGRLTHVTQLKDESKEQNFYVPGSAFIMSKKAWEKTKGFDETLGSYWEDVELSLRARKLGLKLTVAPEIILKHGVAKTTGNNPFYTTYLYHRNQKRVVLRHGGFSRAPFILVYSAVTLRKLFKFIKNKDFQRAKLILKAMGS